MSESTVRLDLRAVTAIVALGAVVLAIIFVQLCGTEDVAPLAERPTPMPRDTSTPATASATAEPGTSLTPGPATATPDLQVSSEGEGRDFLRLGDLAVFGQALEAYEKENGRYPDTGGNIQTLCAFREVDAGCDLEELLSPLPEDPLGDASGNGYWYASDGSWFAVYAQRESQRFDACEEHPDHLQEFDSVFCERGP